MKKLHFSVKIKAPSEKVWSVLWNNDSYRDWTRFFAEGSYAVSDWKEGSKIEFLDPKQNVGMSSVIRKKIPNKFMSFKHITEIKDGRELPPQDWSGATENYKLEEHNGETTLTVDLDIAEEWKKVFEDKFPKALARVKRLSEKM